VLVPTSFVLLLMSLVYLNCRPGRQVGGSSFVHCRHGTGEKSACGFGGGGISIIEHGVD
jgi:hypothetical protein